MNAHQQLIQLMQTEIDMLGCLRSILVRESEMLNSSDVEGLKSVTDEKHRQVEDLEVTGRQRKNLMDSIVGVDTSTCDIAEFFGNDSTTFSLWQVLGDHAERCRELNLTNGAVVDAFTRHVTQTLSVLQGKQPGSMTQGQLYDQTGHATGAAIKHTLIQV